MTKILGLTGGIASGKSTVGNYLRSLGALFIDADKVARDVMRAGSPVVDKIREAFGDSVIREDGEIHRENLGKLVFASPGKRKQLDTIVQGEIRKEIIAQRDELLQKEPPLLVLDIPLLYEQEYEAEVDTVMVVYVIQRKQKDRLMKRDPHLTEDEALNRIYSQIPISEKVKRADIVIDNNGSIPDTLTQVKDWVRLNVPEINLENRSYYRGFSDF